MPVIVDEDAVRSLISSGEALALARETLLAQAQGLAVLSSPSAMALDASGSGGSVFKIKAASIGPLQVSGVRLLADSRNADGRSLTNYTAVFDHSAKDGLSGLVAESWLSSLRTAAFGVAAVEGLLPDRPLRIGLFGAGDIANEIVPALLEAFQVEYIRVLSRRPERTREFVERHRAATEAALSVAESAEHVIRDADLVITLTEAREPLVRPGLLAPGGIVMTMGSHNEVDFGVLQEADTLVVDDPDFASQMGDGGAWVRQGHISRDDLIKRVNHLACNIATAFHQGRRMTGNGRTVALIQGMAIGDVAFAAHALRRYRESRR
jgi:ornithine cyclodeaminase/alanine dehydrogenase-like protein (mu-crystallin family)